jgi:predicted restriction endonuclease
MSAEWQKRVYRKVAKMTREEQEAWRKIRASVLLRDKFSCQRCLKKSNNGKGLSVHHIKPRDHGGIDDLSNLITLCEKCHDVVEIRGYRTHAEICMMDDDPIEERQELPAHDYEESFIRPSWHKYVYGGQKRT